MLITTHRVILQYGTSKNNMKDRNYTSAATFTIERAGEMTTEGRKDLAEWLRHQAEMLQAEGDKYSREFKAEYLYPAT
jgi:hypothetical protein